ncbi:MAG: hypothetical protein AAFV25_23495, partial [Bacteroidota bacterium]
MNDLILKLRKLNIKLGLQGDQLQLDAPKGTMTPELLAEIKQHKSALINFLVEAYGRSNFSSIPKAAEKEFYKLSSAQ